MKFLTAVVFVTIIGQSIVLANELQCYKCVGDECNHETTTQVVNCHEDVPGGTIADTFNCYTFRYEDGGSVTQKQKGCTKRVGGIAACQDVTIPENTRPVSCEVCSETKCNSSSAINLSIVLLTAMLTIRSIF
uniref:Putative conserved secreted protein n=2 Tax=Haematobia irritans TaxID=7368 RepID=A0A1L8EBX5_HAEIR